METLLNQKLQMTIEVIKTRMSAWAHEEMMSRWMLVMKNTVDSMSLGFFGLWKALLNVQTYVKIHQWIAQLVSPVMSKVLNHAYGFMELFSQGFSLFFSEEWMDFASQFPDLDTVKLHYAHLLTQGPYDHLALGVLGVGLTVLVGGLVIISKEMIGY